MSSGLLLLIGVSTLEIFLLGGVVYYCFILEKAEFLDLWFVWGPIWFLGVIAQVAIIRVFKIKKG